MLKRMKTATRWKFTWWKRLLAALISILISFAVGLFLFLLHDFKTDSADFHWGNGGEETVLLYILVILRIPLAATFLLIAPLVLLIPINIQRRYGLIIVSAAAIATLLLAGIFPNHSISQFFTEVRTAPWFFAMLELVVLSGCGTYLLFLRTFDSEV